MMSSPGNRKPTIAPQTVRIIASVYSYLESLNRTLISKIEDIPKVKKKFVKQIGLSNLLLATAQSCGVSKSTVVRCLAKANKENVENQPNVKEKKRKLRYKCDSFTVAVIRQICYQFYERKEYPTIKTMWLKCLEDENFPRIKRETFRKWLLKNCSFKYKQSFCKPVFLERKDIVAQREYYLRNIRHYRKLNYKIFYLDQTWTSPNQRRNKCWQILLNRTQIEEFKKERAFKVLQDVNGWTGGFMVKGGTGRIVVNLIGSENEFLEGAEDVFLSKKYTNDYHTCMNGQHFETWIKSVVGSLPENSVIVLDQAPYHRRRVPETINPKSYWNKKQIAEWMEKKNVPLPPSVSDPMKLLKATMLELCKKYHVDEEFIVDDIAKKSGKNVKILFLPVAHCELNPIELIWAYLKNKVATLNKDGGSQYVLNLTKECMTLVTPELWQGCIREAISYEDKFWDRDRLHDKELTPIISNPNLCFAANDSDEESSSDSEEDNDSEAEYSSD